MDEGSDDLYIQERDMWGDPPDEDDPDPVAVDRLAAALLVMCGTWSGDEAAQRAEALIAEIKASPPNPHGDDDAVIVDELIRTIGILKAKTWDKVMRASIRGKVPNI